MKTDRKFLSGANRFIRACDLMAPNEFAEDGNISDGDRTFTGATLSSGNYEGEVRDIAILHRRSKRRGEPLTAEEQCALRSELGRGNADCSNCEAGRVARCVGFGANFRSSRLGGRKSERFRRSGRFWRC